MVRRASRTVSLHGIRQHQICLPPTIGHTITSLPLTPLPTPSTMGKRERFQPFGPVYRPWHRNPQLSNKPSLARCATISSASSVPPKRCTTPSTTSSPLAPATAPPTRFPRSFAHRPPPLLSTPHSKSCRDS